MADKLKDEQEYIPPITGPSRKELEELLGNKGPC